MKKLTVILMLAAVFFLKEGSPSYAADFDVKAGVSKLSGDTTYRIGYPVDFVYFGHMEGYFPISQLEFPLDVSLLSLEGSMKFSDTWNASFTIQTNITDDPGEMKDSDWLTPSDPTRLDIFSTSNTELDAMIWDINLGYEFYRAPQFSLIVGGGILHQNFDFKCRLIRQYSPSGLRGYDYIGDGSVGLTYEITYTIPYVELGIQSNLTDKFSVGGSLGYSPIVTIEDQDRHILRNKVNRGDLEGNALLLSVEGRYDMFTNWFLMFGIDYLKIETDKEDMVARFEGAQRIYNHTVTEEVESAQTSLMLTVGYAF
jgi:outer membrane protease